jgi:hypothetical protein
VFPTELRKPQNRSQRLVDLVSDSGGKLAERSQAVRLPKLVLEVYSLLPPYAPLNEFCEFLGDRADEHLLLY